MSLPAKLAAFHEEIADLSAPERARRCCELAKQFEKAAKYDKAYEVLSSLWPDRTRPPVTEGLDDQIKADLLQRVGALSGWLNSATSSEMGQEFAKNCLTTSIEMFEKLGDPRKIAEAHGDLALCYWREGALDEARIHLATARGLLGDEDSNLKAILLIRSGVVEGTARRLNEALRLFNAAAPIIEKTDDHGLKGSFHFEYGLVFRQLAAPENREDYLDRALLEYAAASFHFEQAGNEVNLARVENNLGYLYFTIGRYREAHQHLNRSRHLLIDRRDFVLAAQIDDTRAMTFLAEGRPLEAERIIRQAVRTLERSGEQALLAEALTTYGVVLARLGRFGRSREVLQQAMDVAQTAGDTEGAGRAKLSLIEELTSQTAPRELARTYEIAARMLKETQDPLTSKRLVNCALKLIDSLTPVEEPEMDIIEPPTWEGFSFKREVLKIEKALIERALRDAGGSVTKASRLLGFKHHQSLIALINSRHRDLLQTRSAVRKRRHHLFSKPRKMKKKTEPEGVTATGGEMGLNGDGIAAADAT
jgi:tetratricopeptide (TPR) repeat protein